MSLQAGQSNAVFFLKSEKGFNIIFTQLKNSNKMTSSKLVLYLMCLLLGKIGELYFKAAFSFQQLFIKMILIRFM